MNNLVPAGFGPVSSKFAAVPVTDDLSSGVASSFGMVGYRGKVWSIRFRGDEENLMREDGDGPRNSIEVVIVKASSVISKVWYREGYVEGSTAPPDCYSNNGIAPEPSSTDLQSPTCGICPHNQWGSRITPAGKQGKSCADSKRLAVVPLQDLNNEVYGGPMLLRVPAASLQDMAMYGTKMAQLGYPYFAIGTRISFDPDESYPKFQFNAIRPLNDDEADIVLSYADNHTVDRILSENEFTGEIAGPDASPAHHQPVFEQPAPTPTARPSVSKTQAKPNGAAVANQAASNQTVGQQARAAAAATKPKQEPKTTKPEVKQQTVAATPAQQAAAKALANVRQENPAVAAAKAALAAAEAAAALALAEAEASAEEPEAEEEITLQGNAEDTGDEDMVPDDGNVASDFEASLDEMLSAILPAAG